MPITPKTSSGRIQAAKRGGNVIGVDFPSMEELFHATVARNGVVKSVRFIGKDLTQMSLVSLTGEAPPLQVNHLSQFARTSA